MADLLLENQADVDAKANGGYTPLHFAAFGGAGWMAELLLAKNADVNARDDKGKSPLDLVAPGSVAARRRSKCCASTVPKTEHLPHILILSSPSCTDPAHGCCEPWQRQVAGGFGVDSRPLGLSHHFRGAVVRGSSTIVSSAVSSTTRSIWLFIWRVR